jgi:diguanylate cyclase (GGDEF)-like protein
MHGHEAGDVVLQSISATLQSELRSSDLVSRFGGDEFLIMLVDADMDEACAVAERIRHVVERTPVNHDPQMLKIRLSVGVATLDSADSDVGMILRRADLAL